MFVRPRHRSPNRRPLPRLAGTYAIGVRLIPDSHFNTTFFNEYG